MSQDFMDPEVFSDFINEAREHLETIEPNLLELEKSPDNLSLLNEIFRPMHSLKGASGFLGLNQINKLAHKAENIMDELRKGAMPVTPEIMDVILTATDALRLMVENLESIGGEGDVDVTPIVASIEAILSGGGASAPAPAPESPAPAPEKPVRETPPVSEETVSVPQAPKEPAVADEPPAPAPAAPSLAPYALTSFGATHLSDFLEESYETVDEISSSLLTLERDPHQGGDLINDIFRFFHNLKGNSGIIGFHEINRLTHEAETLLNRVRKGEMQSSLALIDLLLAVSDMTEALLGQVDPASGHVTPLDISFLVGHLNRAVERNAVEPFSEGELRDNIRVATESNVPQVGVGAQSPSAASPEEMLAAAFADAGVVDGLPEAGPEEQMAPATAPDPVPAGDAPGSPAPEPLHENRDVEVFRNTIAQTMENVELALDELRKDSTSKDYIDGLYRSFVTMQNSCGFMGLEEIQVYAERTAGLVSSARDSDMDFSLMIDILDQEAAILRDMIKGELESMVVETVPEEAPLESPAPAEEPETGEPSALEPVYESEDVEIFKNTIAQTTENVELALAELRRNPENRDYIDGLYRSFVTMQNSCGYMGLEEIQVYAERTAGLVDSARDSDMDFSLMIDILDQEAAILRDMIRVEVEGMDTELARGPAPSEAPAAEPAQVSAPRPVHEGKGASEKAPATKAEPEAKTSEKAAAPESKPAETRPEAVPPAKEQGDSPPRKSAPPKPAPAQAAPAQAAPGPSSKPKVSSTIRVDHEKLDHLMNLIGELIINRNRFAMLAKHLEEVESHDVTEIGQNLTETTYAMARISDDLQDTIMKVRMVPVQTVFSRFPRLVRDLSRKSGKDIDLITEGEETELDKSVVEVIGDPLVHLIRNSVDHGVEPSEEREAAGKHPKGNVWLRAYHKGNSVAIEIEDDGRGIDPEKMRNVAIKKGIITPEEAKNLDDREALELIFAPGFSSAEKVTDISGRGVGMDVVRTNIKNLKGSVDIQSTVGKGSKFTLTLPLTLAIIDALMVKVSGETFAIPLDAVSETTKIEAEKLTEVNKRKAVTLRGQVLGIVDLHELLELEGPEQEPEILSTVVIQDNQRRLGLVVDRLLERQEIVIQPLGTYLGDQKGISGATIMGDGSVVLILDPHEIYLMATSKAI